VVVVRTADVAAIEQQMETEQAKLPEIEQRFNTARVYADQLAAERTSGRDRFGRTVQVQARTNKEIGDARVVADRINEERRQVKQRVARLDREHKEALTMRTVLAKLVGDETTVQINCAGAAMVSIADGLLPDTKWKVSGGARIVENVLHIKPSSFTPAE